MKELLKTFLSMYGKYVVKVTISYHDGDTTEITDPTICTEVVDKLRESLANKLKRIVK